LLLHGPIDREPGSEGFTGSDRSRRAARAILIAMNWADVAACARQHFAVVITG